MTNQEMFDLCLNHLRQQGRTSTNADGNCFYRGPDGLRCAIGALIPDERYMPVMENLTATNPIVVDAAGITSDQISLASDIQCEMHDFLQDKDFQDRLERSAALVAEAHNLEYRPPLTAAE